MDEADKLWELVCNTSTLYIVYTRSCKGYAFECPGNMSEERVDTQFAETVLDTSLFVMSFICEQRQLLI